MKFDGIPQRTMLAMAAMGVMAFGAGAITALSVHSEPASPPTLKSLTGQIRAASHGALTAVRILQAPKGAALPAGVVPVEVNASGKRALVWVVHEKGRSAFFPGSAFNATGVNLGIPLMRNVLSTGAQVQSTDTQSPFLKAVDLAPGFIWAAPGHTHDNANAVLFMDPNCIFCHKEFEQMKPLVDAGKLVVKVVPVAFLKASSMGKAEAVLEGGMSAYLQDENGFDDSTEEGGIAPLTSAGVGDAGVGQRIQSNTQLLSNLEGGRIATPFMLVRRGNAWQPHMGLLSGADLSTLLGLG